jgi:trehalose 6-phosphate phosphatase
MMQPLLSPAHRGLLAQFAFSNVMVAFDYDGTLAPIVENPRRARMRPSTRALLRQVAERYPCVVISGRSQREVLGLLGEIPVLAVAGNHGLEPWQGESPYEDVVAGWKPHLQEALGGMAGVKIEDKRFSLAIHYRAARAKKKALAAIHSACEALAEVRQVGGKQVVNLIPQGAPNKGTALERLRKRLHCDTAIYLGDDVTDEDVFALHGPGLLGVRVGAHRTSQAGYYLRDQRQVDAFLRALLDGRPSRRAA